MTAGSGLLHEERHEKEFAKNGGPHELVQLWVNVPQKDKMHPPRYQELLSAGIPSIKTEQAAVRIISGTYENVIGPAKTFSPIIILDVAQKAGTKLQFNLLAHYNTGSYIVSGEGDINGKKIKEKQLVNFGWKLQVVEIDCIRALKFLVLSREPIEEAFATYGPFVMNTEKELIQAMEDYTSDKMGRFENKVNFCYSC